MVRQQGKMNIDEYKPAFQSLISDLNPNLFITLNFNRKHVSEE